MPAEPRVAHDLASNADQTFPPSRRIRHHAEFEQAVCAECVANKWFAVYVRRNERGCSRLGMIASKRIMPNAVSRNFAKRLIRDVFRRNVAADSQFDVVVRVRRPLNFETSREGRLALAQLLQLAKNNHAVVIN